MTVSLVILMLFGFIILAAVVVFIVWQVMNTKTLTVARARTGVLFQLKPGLELRIPPKDRKRKMAMILQQFVTYVGDWTERIKTPGASYSIEIHATGLDKSGRGGYGFYIWVPTEDAKLMGTTIGNNYELPYTIDPDRDPLKIYAEKLADPNTGYAKHPQFYTAEFRLASPSYFPIREWNTTIDVDDPTEAFYGIFDSFRELNGVAGIMLTMKPAEKNWKKAGLAYLKEKEFGIKTNLSTKDKIMNLGEPELKPQKQSLDTFEKDEVACVLNKIKQDAFEVVIRIYSSDSDVFELLKDTLERRFRGEKNGFILKESPVSLIDMKARWFDRSDCILSLDEIASVFHPPDCETRAGRLFRGASKAALPPEGLPTVPKGSQTDIFTLLDKNGVPN